MYLYCIGQFYANNDQVCFGSRKKFVVGNRKQYTYIYVCNPLNIPNTQVDLSIIHYLCTHNKNEKLKCRFDIDTIKLKESRKIFTYRQLYDNYIGKVIPKNVHSIHKFIVASIHNPQHIAIARNHNHCHILPIIQHQSVYVYMLRNLALPFSRLEVQPVRQ